MFADGLKPIFSRRFLIVVLIAVGINLFYGLAIAWNLLLVYLSVIFLVGHGFYLLLADPPDDGVKKKWPGSRKTLLPLGLILLVSLALGGIGANWGFPFLAHPDEFSVTVKSAEMIGRGNLDTNNYTHPNDISIYSSVLLYPIVNKAMFSGRFTESWEKDNKPFYLTSRLVSAASGALLTAAAYFVGTMAAPAVGIIAAAAFAIFPLFVENAHFATPDVLVTALLMFVVLFCIRYLMSGGPRDLFLALVFCCLSMAEKYPSFVALILVLAVVLFRRSEGKASLFAIGVRNPLKERKITVALFSIGLAVIAVGVYSILSPDFYKLSGQYVSSVTGEPLGPEFAVRTRTISKLVIAVGLVACAAGVFLRFLNKEKYGRAAFVAVGSPFILFLLVPSLFINFGRALYVFSHEARASHLGSDGLGYLGNLLFYAKDYVSAAGIVSLPFMAIGTIFVFRERRLLPLLFGFFYWIALSASGLHWSRWGLPMYAGALILVSFGLYQSWLFLKDRTRRPAALALLGVLCAIPAASLFLTSITTTYRFALKDTRVAAQTWCDVHGVTQENAIYDGYTPFRPGSAWKVEYPGPATARYVVVSSDMYDRFLNERNRYRNESAMYEKIFSLPLVASFIPVKVDSSSSFELGNAAAQVRLLQRLVHGGVMRGPAIQIFRASDNPALPS